MNQVARYPEYNFLNTYAVCWNNILSNTFREGNVFTISEVHLAFSNNVDLEKVCSSQKARV